MKSTLTGSTDTVYIYKAYDLNIHSEISLPELTVQRDSEALGASAVDVHIRIRTITPRPCTLDGDGAGFCAISGEVYYTLKGVGAFLVSEGREILVDPAPDADTAVLMIYLLGPVLGVALHQRGLLLLHGSAVAADGGAIAFLGVSGAGKSTTAAALYSHGYGLVTDEIVAVDMNEPACPMIRPALPRIKLCPKSAATIGYDVRNIPVYYTGDIRRRREYPIPDGFPEVSLPLRRIYILENDISQRVTPLSRQAAFLELARHAYPDFVSLLEASSPELIRFHHRVKLASAVPIFSLKRRFSLSALPELIRLLETDFTHGINQNTLEA